MATLLTVSGFVALYKEGKNTVDLRLELGVPPIFRANIHRGGVMIFHPLLARKIGSPPSSDRDRAVMRQYDI